MIKNTNRKFIFRAGKILFILFFLLIISLYLWGQSIEFENRFAPVIYSKEGKVLAAGISEDQQWRIACEGQMPKKLATSIRLFEDQYFYYHPGVNVFSLVKAAISNLKAGRIVRGGSTLTMQLARIYYGNKKRTYFQKIKEIFLAFALELNYSKNEILDLYGQYAPFGGNIIGYCAASRFYYAKKPEFLSWSEAVTLAVLPNAPSNIYPGKGQTILIKKRDGLLRKMLEKKIIDSLTYRLSIRQNVPERKNNFSGLTSHLLPYFTKNFDNRENKYVTTIDFSLQKGVSRVVNNYSGRYSARGIDNMAVLVLRNDGKVAAYVANSACKSKECGSKVDIIRSKRSPGSILKPFLYGACLDAGIISRESLLLDIPAFYNGFSPKNYDRRFRGIVNVEDALTQSLNVPAVNLLAKYGIDAFLDDLHKLKIDKSDKTADYYGLSLILGGSEVTMWDIGRAYMNMARTAMKKNSVDISLIGSTTVNKDIDFPLSRGASWQILDILKGVNRPEEQDGWQYFSGQHSISWKTGTSYGYRDAWSVGVTKDYTVVIWVGNADGAGVKGLTGIKKAAPVLFSVFDLLPLSEEIEEPVRAFKSKTVCSKSGYTPTESCEEKSTVPVPGNSHNLPLCRFHRLFIVDSEEKFIVPPDCDVKNTKQKSYFILNPIVNSYFKKYKGKDYLPPPVYPGCKAEKSVIEILYPPQNAEILLPRDVNNKKRHLICSATTSVGVDSLFWFLDDEIISITKKQHKVEIDADTGIHKITILAPSGSGRTHIFKIVPK